MSPVIAIWADVMVYLLHERYKNKLRDGENNSIVSVSYLLYHNVDL